MRPLLLALAVTLIAAPAAIATGDNGHTPPPPNPPPVVTPPPPPAPRCPPGMTPTAGKDGQPGNDECEFPKTTPPSTSTTPSTTTPAAATPPTVITKVETRTVTNTVTKTRTVVKWRTKVKTVVRVKRVMVACPKNTKPYKGKCVQTGGSLTG